MLSFELVLRQIIGVEHNKFHIAVNEAVEITQIGGSLCGDGVMKVLKGFRNASCIVGCFVIAGNCHYRNTGKILKVIIQHLRPLVLVLGILHHISRMQYKGRFVRHLRKDTVKICGAFL